MGKLREMVHASAAEIERLESRVKFLENENEKNDRTISSWV
jgi:hypothetical protein